MINLKTFLCNNNIQIIIIINKLYPTMLIDILNMINNNNKMNFPIIKIILKIITIKIIISHLIIIKYINQKYPLNKI
jgi:hypothetical protein